MYSSPRRRKDLGNPKAAAVSAADLLHLFTNAAQELYSYDHLVDECGEAIRRYLPKQPSLENYITILGCLTTLILECERRAAEGDPLIEWAPDNLKRFRHEYFINVVSRILEERRERNGD